MYPLGHRSRDRLPIPSDRDPPAGIAHDGPDDVQADAGVRGGRDAARDRINLGQPSCKLAYGRNGQHRKAACPRQDENAAPA